MTSNFSWTNRMIFLSIRKVVMRSYIKGSHLMHKDFFSFLTGVTSVLVYAKHASKNETNRDRA